MYCIRLPISNIDFVHELLYFYEKYKNLADKQNKVIFGGRLGEYKYYDMDKTIEVVLDMCQLELY